MRLFQIRSTDKFVGSYGRNRSNTGKKNSEEKEVAIDSGSGVLNGVGKVTKCEVQRILYYRQIKTR